MQATGYSKDDTALLFIDPYNDFLSEGGKLWPMVKEVATVQNLLEHLKQIMAAVRGGGMQVFIVPHHRSSKATAPGGTTSARTRKPPPPRGRSRRGAGAPNGHRTSHLTPAMSLSRNTGARAALPTPTWTCCSSSTASAK